jgi:vitamin B12 transporter
MLALVPLLLNAVEPAASQQIVVTGRGLDRPLGEQAYGSVLIDRRQLEVSASKRLEQVLGGVAGFQLFRRSDAASANPTSQGATLRALGGNASSRLLLVLDGVPQTDPFGGWISWPAYDPRRLGEVRIMRGGGVGAYGPGALAGTVELQSATPAELSGLKAEFSYGSRDSMDFYAGYGLALGEVSLSLSGTHARGDGFIPIVADRRGPADRPSPYRQSSLSLRLLVPLAGGVELQVSALHFRDERERGTAFTGNETEGTDGSIRLVGPRWSILGYVQKRDYYNSFASVDPARMSATQVAEQYDVPSSGYGVRGEWRPHMGRGIELRIGADWRGMVGETRELFSFQNGVGTRGREAGGRSATIGVFGEAAWSTGPLLLTGGARIDRWWIKDGFLDERVLASGAVLTDVDHPDRTAWEPTVRAAAALQAAPSVTIRAAAYVGWRLPTLNELYRPFRVGADATAANAGLAPERLTGIEAGLEYRPVPSLKLGATAFMNRLENAIANVTLGHGPGIFPGVGFVAGQFSRRDNLGAVQARGIELDAVLAVEDWRVTAGYAFVAARVEASGPAAPLEGLRPAQTPRHSLIGSIGWSAPGGANANIAVRYSGSRYEDDLNLERLPDALTFDASAALPLGRNLSLQARAENLTGERVVAGVSNGILERATPRTFWIGLSWRD